MPPGTANAIKPHHFEAWLKYGLTPRQRKSPQLKGQSANYYKLYIFWWIKRYPEAADAYGRFSLLTLAMYSPHIEKALQMANPFITRIKHIDWVGDQFVQPVRFGPA